MNYPKTTKVWIWLYGLASEDNGSLTVDAGKPAPSWQHVNFTPLVPRACAWLAYWLGHMENFNKKPMKFYFVVSTHFQKYYIVKMDRFPQIEIKTKHIWVATTWN